MTLAVVRVRFTSDFPDDMIRAELDEDEVDEMAVIPDPPRPGVLPDDIERAIAALESAEKPLAIIGVWRGHAPVTKCGAYRTHAAAISGIANGQRRRQ